MTFWYKDDYIISTDKNHLDRDVIYSYLHHDSYWAQNIPRDVLLKSIEHTALCFGVYQGDPRLGSAIQVGFARVISDLATFAYLADVFILPSHQKKGLSKWLMSVIMEHPDLQGLRRFMLATNDAHSLYAKYGFAPLDRPDKVMQTGLGINAYQNQ